ncbi:MAG TPA: 30S ribosomal protein S6 [Dehalococcoidia bacterium]|nr:30S ribosomal protein S6 [Dehalococcoidia bacterium]
MTDYELMLVISPDVENDDVTGTVDRVQQFIMERGGQVTDTDTWGRRRLAYPINRFTEGNYVVTHFRIEPGRIRDLESSLQLSEDVIRHLVVKVGD